MEPIFCIPTSGSANSVRSAYDPGSRPRGLSLEPNGILSTRFRSNSTPRYVIYYSVGPYSQVFIKQAARLTTYITLQYLKPKCDNVKIS